MSNADDVLKAGIVRIQQLDDEVKRLKTSHTKLLNTIRNALTSLAIINMPITGTGDVATDKDLMDTMANSFKQAIAEAEKL